MSNAEQWVSDIARLSVRQGLSSPPRFSVSTRDNTNAEAGRNGILVSRDLLDASDSVRSYVIAHELGHCAKRHWILNGGAASAAMASTLFGFTLLRRPVHSSTGGFLVAMLPWLLFVILPWGLWYAMYLRNELEADRFAAKCIGVEACLVGSIEMGLLSGTLKSFERHIKLASLRKSADKS